MDAQRRFLGRDKSTPRTFVYVWNKCKILGFVHLVFLLGTGCGSEEVAQDPRVFRYNESAAITSLDPAAARSLEHMWVVDQLYDGLVELGPDLGIVPALATDWAFSEDGTECTFQLRQDVVFASGRRVTADDVVFSLERLRDPSVVSSGGWILERSGTSSGR